MTKRNLTIGTIFLTAVLVGGFYLWSEKKTNSTQTGEKKVMVDNKQKQNQQTKNDSKEENNQEQKNNQEQSGKHFKQLSPEEIEKLKKEKNLVWYEIPELNIKFLIEKEIANIIGYRDFYVEDNKVDGKELYIKGLYIQNSVKTPIVFADLIVDRAVKDTKTGKYHFLSKYCLGNKNIRILVTKKDSYRVCYLRKIDNHIENLSYGQNNNLRNIIEKLLRGYLEETFVILINDNH